MINKTQIKTVTSANHFKADKKLPYQEEN